MDWSHNRSGTQVKEQVASNGCVTVRVRLFNDDVKAKCEVPTEVIAKCSILNPPVRVRCSFTCDVATTHYLRVTPTTVQWITEDDIVEYEVRSNVEWKIE